MQCYFSLHQLAQISPILIMDCVMFQPHFSQAAKGNTSLSLCSFGKAPLGLHSLKLENGSRHLKAGKEGVCVRVCRCS